MPDQNNQDKADYRLGFDKRDNREISYMDRLQEVYGASSFSDVEKVMHAPMYMPRQDMTRFLYRYELYKKIIGIHGSILECGVAFGSGLMAFAQFSAIFEPVNYTRKIIGFDTFAGFPRLSDKDVAGEDPQARTGGMAVDSYAELEKCVELYDQNRSIGHIPKVELVKGDVVETIPKYLENNPHLVVSLLYLDFDLYEPTAVALRHLVPRMPKGSIIAFDELGIADWAGETQAVVEEIGIRNLRIERYPFDTTRSFAVLD